SVASLASGDSLISWPPSRALRWLREARGSGGVPPGLAESRRREAAARSDAAFGPAAAARRNSQVYTCPSFLGPFHVRDELLGVGPGHHGHQFPAVVAPVVQDLLGGMHQQGHGRVLPLSHSR